MDVIFLDIDGVMRTVQTLGRDQFDQGCVAALNRITTQTGASIVLSSVWRIFIGETEEIAKFMAERGVVGQIIGKTPDYRGAPRGTEIQGWLYKYREAQRFHALAGFTADTVRFVILDDDGDMEDLMPHLVRTQWMHGLTEQDADRAIALLEAQNEHEPRT